MLYAVETPEPPHNQVDERDLPISNDDCDSSLDSYDSYQPTPSYHLDDTNKDDDLAEVMFGSPIMEALSVHFADNCDKSTTLEPTQEYPSYDDDLDLVASEMEMLELLVLCDSSGAHHGFMMIFLPYCDDILKRDSLFPRQRDKIHFSQFMRTKVEDCSE